MPSIGISKIIPIVIFLLTYLIQNSDPTNTEYVAATNNPPHGCPNYALCTDVTTTLLKNEDDTDYYEYGCNPANCICVNGTTNSTDPCDTIIDQCTSTPCNTTENSVCKYGINSYYCACTAGFTGANCDVALGSACDSSTVSCENGGTCNVDGSGTTTCTCPPGYSGDTCQTKDMCYNVNCTAGTCKLVLDDSNFLCECPDGVQGRYCESNDTVDLGPTKEGCYNYNYASIGATTTKFSDVMMTVAKCDAYAQTFTPPMKYLTLSGTWCMVNPYQIVNDTISDSDIDCKRTCNGNASDYCGRLSYRAIVYDASRTVTDPDACFNATLCNDDTGNGICVNLQTQDNGTMGYQCLCGPLWTGPDCGTALPPACDPDPCVNGTCVLNSQFNTKVCDCEEGFSGDNCQYEEICKSSTCLYGGTCVETAGTYTCECLSLYSGTNCQNINRCKYENPCVNGTCSTTVDGISPNFECTCQSGYNGTRCDTEINYCDSNPCQFNSTCTPYFKGYTCVCLPGLTGANCSTIIDLCVGQWSNGVWIKSPCNTKDAYANCTKAINSFVCSCSDKWTDKLCDLNILIKDVLMAIYGYVDLNMISLLNDLMQNPSQIKDMVPFITGLLTSDERSDLSWDVGDLFNWIAFEDKRLNMTTDIYKWNDVVLGNCFTFNHRDQNFTYTMRSAGRHGGILAYMRVRQDEYAPWYDTAAINVFIHNKDEYVFSESVRYNAEPRAQSTINIYNTRYTRLGGKYGKCVKKTKEVKAYYYPGSYSTDGCLRTCYQDKIQSVCECMDPRYPQGFNATSCQLAQRPCVTDASDAAGDPSTWSSCVCPLPCSNQQYSVRWSKADFVYMSTICEQSSNQADCQYQMGDNLLVSVVLPQLDFQIYAETPAMDFNKFLSQLGGQLGVLMGINLVSFIEIVFLIAGLIMVCCRKYDK